MMKIRSKLIFLLTITSVILLGICYTIFSSKRALDFDDFYNRSAEYDNQQVSLRCRIASGGVDGLLLVSANSVRPFPQFIFVEFSKKFSDEVPMMDKEQGYSRIIVVNGTYKKGGYVIRGNVFNDVPYFVISKITQ